MTMNFVFSFLTIALLVPSGTSLSIPSDSGSERVVDDPPPFYESARMARWITHESEWVSMATIAKREPIVGYPFVNIFSLSDGPIDNSTGVPYMYVTEFDMSVEDIEDNNQVSITMTLAQGEYCEKYNLDPESPLCAHVIMTGEFVKVTPGSEEEDFARLALFSRHPAMENWPADHGWFFAKVDIQNIQLLAFFGGAVTVPVTDYYSTQL